MQSIGSAPARPGWPLPVVDTNLCDLCGRCVDSCPTHAASLIYGENGAAVGLVIDPARCTYCTDCEAVCPKGAIRCAYEIVAVWQTARDAGRQE